MKSRKGIARSVKICLSLCGVGYIALMSARNWTDHAVGIDGERIAGTIFETRGEHHFVSDTLRLAVSQPQALQQAGISSVSYGLRSTWQYGRRDTLFLALAVFLTVPILQSLRIWILANACGVTISFANSARMTWAGNFINFAVPLGSTAGDAYKAWELSKQNERLSTSATLILFDRAIGLGTLLLGVAAVVVFLPSDRLVTFRTYVLVLSGSGIALLIVYLASPLRGSSLFRRLVGRFEALNHVDRTLFHMLTHWRATTKAVAITLAIHVSAACSFWFAFASLGLVWDHNAPTFYASFSLGELVKALPGPPQGVGTMELAYGWLFAGSGSTAQVLSAAFAIRAINLLWALPGASLFLVGRDDARPRVAAESRAI